MFKTIPRYLHFCYLGDKKAPLASSKVKAVMGFTIAPAENLNYYSQVTVD